ncbi:hypothetical protein OIU74_006940 [Salix koriyanagi]|uniref:Uncharacterized protein n=1 Tax=Salix koriyanagi TaxID=2511006 RepID=A0A9Q0U2F2_9ROSI|nr:hypothetical protein OIU74_006940 [Salix koriyanagi]
MVLNKKSRKESTLKKILKVPLRVLARAMDFYMKGMAEYSDQVCVMSCPTGNFNNMPRSYSVSSTNPNHLDDDHRDLLRAASTRSNLGSRNKKINVDVPARQQCSHTKSATRVGDNMPRSHSVPPIGRIDEETPCDFDEEDVKSKRLILCPILGDAPRRRSSSDTAGGLDKSSSFGGFAQGIFPNVQSRSSLRKKPRLKWTAEGDAGGGAKQSKLKRWP